MIAVIYARKIVLAGLFALGIACSDAPPPPARQAAPSPPAVPAPPFEVPGSAFADGRDEDAQPPLTIMRINAWDAAQRQRVVCQVPHAAAVQLLDAQYVPSEERHYFLVEAAGCKGWLPESFLSATRKPPIGDRQ